MFQHFKTGAIAAAALILSSVAPGAEGIGRVSFNQTWIEEQQRDVDVSDIPTVFAEIFGKLPDRAFVWPTENYYYFSFTANGRNYAGNFRLHPEERDEGLINFAYFDTTDPTWIQHKLLGPEDGVEIERISALDYEVTALGRTVTFALNPISQDPPVATLFAPDEAFVGRTFDESGMVFLLGFNETAKQFFWLLDPEQKAQTPLSAMSPTVSVHVQSGFVFVNDQRPDRLVLIGVDNAQVLRNTYYDGPFDQLADNWLPETRFKEFAETSNPGLVGLINARGEFNDQPSRMAVMPYMHYRYLEDIWVRVQSCEMQAGPEKLQCLLRPGA